MKMGKRFGGGGGEFGVAGGDLASVFAGEGRGGGGGPMETIKIETPVVDKADGRITLPGAFWNEKLADWLDVGLCGRRPIFA